MAEHRAMLSICIIGSGALACLFAARLSCVANVRIVGSWRAQIDAIQARGVALRERDGRVVNFPVRACCDSTSADIADADFIIVLVKSYQTPAVFERIWRCVKPESVIVTLQNGLGNLEALRGEFVHHYVGAGVTMQGASLADFGSVIHAGDGNTVVDDCAELAEFFALLNAANVTAQGVEEAGASSISEVLWRKLIVNSAINPLTALLRQSNGYLADNPIARALAEATAIESAQVAVLEGAWSTAPVNTAAGLTANAASVTAANRSSMLQDISRGNRTEISAICGEVVARARKHGFPIVYNALWLKLIQQLESVDISASELPIYSVDQLAELVRRAFGKG